tara:strand:- start:291 stop:521 length:231 start_codon:yes stop_codon:yes gene_type:complete
MDESQVVDIWMMFKEYLDKKHVDMAAERYIDLCADYGVTDIALKDSIGHDSTLDNAINYYLDLDNDDVLDEEVDWD